MELSSQKCFRYLRVSFFMHIKNYPLFRNGGPRVSWHILNRCLHFRRGFIEDKILYDHLHSTRNGLLFCHILGQFSWRPVPWYDISGVFKKRKKWLNFASFSSKTLLWGYFFMFDLCSAATLGKYREGIDPTRPRSVRERTSCRTKIQYLWIPPIRMTSCPQVSSVQRYC